MGICILIASKSKREQHYTTIFGIYLKIFVKSCAGENSEKNAHAWDFARLHCLATAAAASSTSCGEDQGQASWIPLTLSTILKACL
jgi:hypothetical protein